MKTIYLFFALIFLSITVYSQHDLQSSLYPDNKFLVNPANAGDKNFSPHFILGYRYNFTGISGSLRRPMFGFHSPVSNEMGLGGLLSREQVGVFEYYSFTGSYSYNVFLSKKNTLRLGISSGLYSRRINMSKVKVDELNDNALQPEYFSSVYYFAGAGFELELHDFSFNISLPKLYAGEDKTFIAAAVSGLAYNFNINDAFFTPSVYVHYWKNNPVRFDLNLFYKMTEKYFLLLSVKSDKSATVGGGFNINDLSIGYIFELNTAFVPASGGTHEVILSYSLDQLKFKRNKRF